MSATSTPKWTPNHTPKHKEEYIEDDDEEYEEEGSEEEGDESEEEDVIPQLKYKRLAGNFSDIIFEKDKPDAKDYKGNFASAFAVADKFLVG